MYLPSSPTKPAVQAGIELFRQVALEAQQASGDGTTTATILARAICNAYADHPNMVEAVVEIERLTKETVRWIQNRSEELDFDTEDDDELDRLNERLKFVATVGGQR